MLSRDAAALDLTGPLRRAEYDRLVDLGVFDDRKVELLDGRVVEMSPTGERHTFVYTRLNKLLVLALGDRAVVRPDCSFAASDVSEPEPDIAVVAPGDYLDDHPESAFLIIEVAVSSLDEDRRLKNRIYASAGVPEYWVVDVEGGVVEVYRQPGPDGYVTLTRHGRDEVLVVPGFADVRVALGEVLPPLEA